MQTITNKIGHFLVTNTVWIFVMTIIFVSFQRIMLFESSFSGEGMVYLAIEKWQLYFQFAGSIILLYSPVLLFSFFRKKLRKSMNRWVFYLLWGFCFVLYSYLAFYFKLDELFPPLRVHTDSSVAFGIFILAAELIIQFNEFLVQKINIGSRLKQIKAEKAIILILICIAFLFSFPPFNRSIVGHGDNIYYIGEIVIDFLKWLFLFFTGYIFYRINHYLLIEKVLKIRGIFYYFFAFIGLGMVFFPIFAVIISDYLVSGQVWHLPAEDWIPSGERSTSFNGFPSYLPWQWMFSSIPIILVYQWWKQKNDISTLESERSEANLAALKQQINPHFLFNTLNSLYALGIEEQSEKTADGIAKLGTLMRYNLNDAQKKFIPLSKEIDYIKKYIELQKLRLTNNNQLSVNILGETANKQIAPLLLIPFIENAFKFGLSSTEKTKIDLTITMENSVLKMHLFNTIIRNRQVPEGNGIGISNTRKRLAHLYPSQYELIIEETAEEFEVHLEIELAEGMGQRA